ncbi:hypothetical protein DL771_009074 [Monosporascus sp. 5C6A]|nr:hypothetical protein DL771_009074 [Monosporascus sp. 5C6A]
MWPARSPPKLTREPRGIALEATPFRLLDKEPFDSAKLLAVVVLQLARGLPTVRHIGGIEPRDVASRIEVQGQSVSLRVLHASEPSEGTCPRLVADLQGDRIRALLQRLIFQDTAAEVGL